MGTISNVNDAHWDVGKQRVEVIRPLAEQRICSRASILEAANILQLSERHIYKLVQKYRASQGLLTSLIPKKPNGGKGRSRLLKQQESLIYEVIENLYLTPQKLTPRIFPTRKFDPTCSEEFYHDKRHRISSRTPSSSSRKHRKTIRNNRRNWT